VGLRVLVTGFETFSHHQTNPSEQLVLNLKKIKFEFELAGLILPVTFSDSFKILETKVLEYKPDYIISFGLAENRQKICLEARAKNLIHTKIPDNNGVQILSRKINCDGETFLFTQLDLLRIEKKLNEKNLEISQDTGSYVCNFLYYQSLQCENSWKAKSLFVHLPAQISSFSYLDFAQKLLVELVEG
jgi:pyroglutamyl-peptidase